MALEQALAFAAFALVAAITPGPSNVMVTAAGAVAGVRGGLPCLLGVAAGMALMMFVVCLGVGAVVLDRPALMTGLKWVGAAFLLWLAWKIGRASGALAEGEQRAVGFAGAAAFQWLNPKSWLVTVSAAGTYLDPAGPPAAMQALLLAALFFAVALPACFPWLAFGAGMRRMLGSPRRRRVFNAVMGLLLAASVILFVA